MKDMKKIIIYFLEQRMRKFLEKIKTINNNGIVSYLYFINLILYQI